MIEIAPKEKRNEWIGRNLMHQYNAYILQFSPAFAIPYETFKKQAPKLKNLYAKWRKSHSEKMNDFVLKFSPEIWSSLSSREKDNHSLISCNECASNFKLEVSEHPITKSCVALTAMAPKKAITKNALKDITLEIYNKINENFENVQGISFAKAQTKVKSLKLQSKTTKVETRSIFRLE